MIETILDDLEPVDLGLPEKFKTFRQIQREIVDFGIYGSSPARLHRRFRGIGAPTGVGKALSAQAMGKLAGVKFGVLTATNSLLDQNKKDFESCGLVDIRGKSNYECKLVNQTTKQHLNCEEGGEEGCNCGGPNP